MPTFPLMGFSRLRMGIDGQGITTLAAAWGCPLKCRMCLNRQCRDPKTTVRRVTPEELYEMCRVDDLYFQATGGGVTFGGGEPLAHADFIAAFREKCGNRWRVAAETSLYVPEENVHTAAGCVDEFIADIKDVDPGIYRRYAGGDNTLTLRNLEYLLRAVGPGRVMVRVPLIPGYNTPEDVGRSVAALKGMGVENFDRFTYRAFPEPADAD